MSMHNKDVRLHNAYSVSGSFRFRSMLAMTSIIFAFLTALMLIATLLVSPGIISFITAIGLIAALTGLSLVCNKLIVPAIKWTNFDDKKCLDIILSKTFSLLFKRANSDFLEEASSLPIVCSNK